MKQNIVHAIAKVVAGRATGSSVLITSDGKHWSPCDTFYEPATGERRGFRIGNEIVEESMQTREVLAVLNSFPRLKRAKKKSNPSPFYEKFLTKKKTQRFGRT